MSSLISISVDGIANPVLVHSEYSATYISDDYKAPITTISSIYDALGIPTSSNPTLRSPTIADANNIVSSMQTLLNLAQNGVDDPNGVPVTIDNPSNPGNPITVNKFFLTLEMGQSVDKIQKTLDAVGFTTAYNNYLANPTNTAAQTAVTEALKRWKDLSGVGLDTIIQNSLNAVSTNQSLQAMVQLEYVKDGNDLIYNSLASLKDALNLTNQSLTLLQQVQDLHNKVNIQPVDATPINAFTSGNPVINLSLSRSSDQFSSIDDYSHHYTDTADPLFNQPLNVVPDDNPATAVPAGGSGDPISSATTTQFNQLKGQLTQMISALDKSSGVTAATRDPNSLAAKLQQVLDDMNHNSFNTWVTDNESSVNSSDSGNIQTRISEAITQGESLNDQQKQEVQQQLFVFQEFYQSASNILTTITQTIVRMAQGMSKG